MIMVFEIKLYLSESRRAAAVSVFPFRNGDYSRQYYTRLFHRDSFGLFTRPAERYSV